MGVSSSSLEEEELMLGSAGWHILQVIECTCVWLCVFVVLRYQMYRVLRIDKRMELCSIYSAEVQQLFTSELAGKTTQSTNDGTMEVLISEDRFKCYTVKEGNSKSSTWFTGAMALLGAAGCA